MASGADQSEGLSVLDGNNESASMSPQDWLLN